MSALLSPRDRLRSWDLNIASYSREEVQQLESERMAALADKELRVLQARETKFHQRINMEARRDRVMGSRTNELEALRLAREEKRQQEIRKRARDREQRIEQRQMRRAGEVGSKEYKARVRELRVHQQRERKVYIKQQEEEQAEEQRLLDAGARTARARTRSATTTAAAGTRSQRKRGGSGAGCSRGLEGGTAPEARERLGAEASKGTRSESRPRREEEEEGGGKELHLHLPASPQRQSQGCGGGGDGSLGCSVCFSERRSCNCHAGWLNLYVGVPYGVPLKHRTAFPATSEHGLPMFAASERSVLSRGTDVSRAVVAEILRSRG